MAYASYIFDASKKSKYTMFVKEITVMNFENCFPLWNDLNTTQKKIISDNLITQYVKKGTIIHNGNLDCTGLLLVKSGQLRTYILSDEGREITLYRLFDMDMCLLSASCIIRSIQFEVTIEAEKDTDLWIIPAEIYKGIMKESAPVANYTNELIEGTNELKITHETIANHLGSHREVITRMLRYFQGEGLVKLSRGKITILDPKRLETLQRS